MGVKEVVWKTEATLPEMKAQFCSSKPPMRTGCMARSSSVYIFLK